MDIKEQLINNIVKKVLSENYMLQEYKNPEDCQLIGQYADGLQKMHDRIIKNGLSRHEITMTSLEKIIKELRVLQHEMSM